MILNSPSRIHSLLDPVRFMRYGTGPGGAAGAAGVSAEAAVYLNELIPYPGVAREAAIVAFIDGLVEDDLWEHFDLIWLSCTDNAHNSLVNVINGEHGVRIEYGTRLTFTADSGWDGGNIVLDFLSTLFNPTVGTPKFQRNDAALHLWTGSNVAGGSYDIYATTEAADTTTLPKLGMYLNWGAHGGELNGPNFEHAAVAAAVGMNTFQRINSSTYEYWENGVLTDTATPKNSTGVDNGIIRVAFRGLFRFFAIGSSLDATKYALLKSRVQTYITAIHGSTP